MTCLRSIGSSQKELVMVWELRSQKSQDHNSRCPDIWSSALGILKEEAQTMNRREAGNTSPWFGLQSKCRASGRGWEKRGQDTEVSGGVRPGVRELGHGRSCLRNQKILLAPRTVKKG